MVGPFYIYILASYTQRLYIGQTNDIEGRMWKHRMKTFTGHTAKYNIDRLVYLEEYTHVDDAIARERQLKIWNRQKKIHLIVAENPNGKDLCIELFDWSPNEFSSYPSPNHPFIPTGAKRSGGTFALDCCDTWPEPDL